VEIRYPALGLVTAMSCVPVSTTARATRPSTLECGCGAQRWVRNSPEDGLFRSITRMWIEPSRWVPIWVIAPVLRHPAPRASAARYRWRTDFTRWVARSNNRGGEAVHAGCGQYSSPVVRLCHTISGTGPGRMT
jgi:hypothetical protein